MVLKAKVDGNKTYFLYNDKCYVCNDVVTVPTEYIGDFDCDGAMYIENYNHILKDMQPDKMISYKPLVDFITEDSGWVCSDTKGYCKTDILRSTTGTWMICSMHVVYKYTNEVRVLKRGNCRHRKDTEYEELKVNLRTGKSVTTRRFFDKNMITEQYVFDMGSRSWVLENRVVDTEIIGIKRT